MQRTPDSVSSPTPVTRSASPQCPEVKFNPRAGFSRTRTKLCVFIVLFGQTIMPNLLLAQQTGRTPSAAEKRFYPLPLNAGTATGSKLVERYGVPFMDGTLPLSSKGKARIEVNATAQRIFLLGMTDSAVTRSWFDPRDYSVRFFVGDDLGKITLDYTDGSTQVYPLILGESVWWGVSFWKCPEPIVSDPHLRASFSTVLRLYPPAPVPDGKYVAVIQPKPLALRSITFENSAAKSGGIVINGITLESTDAAPVSGMGSVPAKSLPPEFATFVEKKVLRLSGENEAQAQTAMEAFRQAFYFHADEFQGHVAPRVPVGYSGPRVSFKGNSSAEILANVQDMVVKVGDEGMYHTSTAGALFCWAANQYGTYRPDVGRYYFDSWTRDMGRTLQQLTELGYTKEAQRCADYCLRAARLWEIDPTQTINGVPLPRHWGRIANRPDKTAAFENDGHGLTTLFLFRLWQRLPNRDDWLRVRWPDVQAAGDWILWQFDHPEISGATDVLHTTGECAAMSGYSVYADEICLDALQALAQMADSIGETPSALRWRTHTDKMRQAISRRYIVDDVKYGRVWTLASAGWPHLSTVLGPLISRADCQGYAPEDDDPEWHSVNVASYERLIDTYKPAGFYGQAMGYGQGFVTQAALLLDRMHEASGMLDWAAREIFDPRSGSFVVPEGVQIDPTGKYWYHIGDLGNGVQEAEIVKALRIVIGLDDARPDRVQFFPRLPYGWTEMAVEKYPVLFERSGHRGTALVNYHLQRSAGSTTLEIAADKDIGPVAIRLGPFENQADASHIHVNETRPAGSIERSGDSWWVRLTIPVGSENATH